MRRSMAVLALLGTALAGAGPAVVPTGGDVRGREITLLTGDRVLLGAGGQVTPIRGPGREGMGFSIRRTGDHLYVVPDDALAPVAAGRVDRGLFDVALLDRENHDEGLPLIVQGGTGPRSAAGTTDFRPLPAIDGGALRIPSGDGTFWRSVAGTDGGARSAVGRIWLDATVRLTLDRGTRQIGAPAAWAAGYTGTGVTVAVLDSGVDATHPDLAGRIAASRNFTPEPDTDLVGHGTHVAATVASVDDTYRGVAPGARLVVGKVIGRDGSGPMSWLLEGLEWASTEQRAKVVNLSLGGQDTPEVDPIEEAVNRLTARNGTLFVVGAGNNGGGGAGSVSSPSTAEAALSVGAVDRDGAVAAFSGQGPRHGDHAIKPDVTAPGVGIVAARSKDGAEGTPGEEHMAGSGTSMSAPHVAGAAALVFQAHPDWTPARVKAALMASATPRAGEPANRQGAGLVNVGAAVGQEVFAEQPSVSFGLVRWPHDGGPVTRALTYRNTSATAVTLDVTVPGDPGTFTVSAPTVTVPAGGTASVAVTATPRAGESGQLSGQVVATGSGTTVRTPVAVTLEEESYDLTVTPLDRDGEVSADAQIMLGGYSGMTDYFPTPNPDGTVTVRAPRGRYHLSVDIRTGDGTDFVVVPWLELSGDHAITVDARTAGPVVPSVERADADLVTAVTGFVVLGPTGGFTAAWVDTAGTDLRTAQHGPSGPADRFFGAQQAVFAAPGADGTFTDSPYVYNLAWFTPGKAFTGARRVRDASLASVRTENLPDSAGDRAAKGARATSTRSPLVAIPGTLPLSMRLPFTREELYTTDGVSWTATFFQNPKDGEFHVNDGVQEAPARAYVAGRTYRERWNGAVFGPSLPSAPGGARWAVVLDGTRLVFRVPLFGSTSDTLGEATVDSALSRVTRDGEEVCRSATTTCEIPGDPPHGRYRVSTEATRSVADTSTKVSAVWEIDHDGTPVLPVQVVRFGPSLDAANTAPGGRWFAVPVGVHRNPGASPAAVESLTVEVSYDDGAHWTKAPVVGGLALLDHPDRGSVSLRATVTDSSGNTAEQTILRAYHLR